LGFSGFVDLPVIDCHVHLGTMRATPTEEGLREQGKTLVEVIRRGHLKQMYTSGGYADLRLKAEYPDLFYAGGPIPRLQREHAEKAKVDWEEYIRGLVDAGFDGIGEVVSKPAPREGRVPLDSPHYEGFWSTCEKLGYTVLCHVADPEEFWDEGLIPKWAKDKGWGYYVGGYPTKGELYREMENVLDRHPGLKIVLCHFYFMSANLEGASNFLARYGNAHFDLSLGIELMYNISRRRDDWRDFFIRHQDRILFGTDIGVSRTLQQHLDRIWLIRKFLESDDEFHTPQSADPLLTRYEEPYVGLKLPKAALEKIYAKNFQRLWGKKARKVDLTLKREPSITELTRKA